jgi:hypothetical protein
MEKLNKHWYLYINKKKSMIIINSNILLKMNTDQYSPDTLCVDTCDDSGYLKQ